MVVPLPANLIPLFLHVPLPLQKEPFIDRGLSSGRVIDGHRLVAMDVDVSFDGSPGSRVRISTPQRNSTVYLPVPTERISPRVSEPVYDKLSKFATTLSEDLDGLRSKIKRMDARDARDARDVPKLSDVQPGSQLISSTNPALSTIAASVLNDKVNSIKSVLATETRARVSGDDDNSRRLQIMEHKQTDLELRFRTWELEKNTMTKENAEALKIVRQELAQVKKDVERMTKDSADALNRKLQEEMEKLQEDRDGKDRYHMMGRRADLEQMKLRFPAAAKSPKAQHADSADALNRKLQEEIEKLREDCKKLQPIEETLKQAENLVLEKVKAASRDLEESIEQFRAEMESEMKKEFDTFNRKASKDSEEKDRKMAEKTSDLDRLVNSFASDFQAKLGSKVDGTRLTQEIKDIQKEIQGERQKREVLESETRDQKARLVPMENRVSEAEQRTKEFIQRSGYEMEEERQKTREERANLKREARELEVKMEESAKRQVQGLEEKLQQLLEAKVDDLKLQKLEKDLISRSDTREQRLRQELKDYSDDVRDRTEKIKKEFKDRVGEVESFVQRLREHLRQI
eukprot:s972_g28.t3